MTLLAVTPFIPLVGAAAIWLAGARPDLREAATLLTAGALFAAVAAQAPGVLAGERPEAVLYTVLPGLALAFESSRSACCLR